MTTELLNVFENEQNSIKSAVQYLINGDILAFPTETVYGLGADLFNAAACENIFKAKNRPADNPLAAHISDLEMVKDLCDDIPEEFYTLANRFLPGPLSIILKAKSKIPAIVTAGGATLAIRNPLDDVFTKLSRSFGRPIAATSANYSGKPSPTNHKHVMQDLQGRIPAILAAGDCKFKLESTVLSLCTPQPTIFRLGAVAIEEIESVLGKECICINREPGGLKNAPNAPVFAFTDYDKFIINLENTPSAYIIGNDSYPLNLYNLFEYYRDADENKASPIIIFINSDNAKNEVLMNRIKLSGAKFL